jgi:hypothetical protein
LKYEKLKNAVNFQTLVKAVNTSGTYVVVMWDSALRPWRLGKLVGNGAAELSSAVQL